MVQDEDGKNIMTHDYVVALCEYNGQYTTPKCNNKLFLHYKSKSNPSISVQTLAMKESSNRPFEIVSQALKRSKTWKPSPR